MLAQVALKLTGPMDHLRLVWQTGETLLDSMSFDEDPEGTRYHVLVALQEMVTNVLRHAYRGDETKTVEVVFELADEQLHITLRDHGPAFDPLQHECTRPDTGLAMPTEVGGYGIQIARQVMDRLEYRRSDGWNCLRMTKFARANANAAI